MSIFKRALEALIGKKELQEEINKTKKDVLNLNLAVEKIDYDLNVKEKPCVNKLVYNVNNKTLQVISCSGDTYAGFNIEPDQLESFRNADNDTIIALLTPKKKEVVNNSSVEEQEKELVSNFLDIFNNQPDFEVIGNSVYFSGIKSVEIPSLIVAAFIEILQKEMSVEVGEEYQSLKAFTLKLLLNPIQESREHCLKFVRNFDIKLTNTGNMVMYRRIVSVGKSNKDLIEFVSKQYLKVKSWKKKVSNYDVFKKDDNYFISTKSPEEVDYDTYEGNLDRLYLNLSELAENRYTDNHTKSYDIRIGATYKINDEDIDLNKNGSCGGALHLADGKKFLYNSFGDTPVVCLVSPQHIYKIDSGYSGKIGVRQMFIAAITTQDENGNYEDIDNQDLVNFDELYHNESLEELTQALKTKSVEATSVSTAMSEVSLKDVEVISNLLKNRIVTI
jgi:hypothetical protein